MKTNDIAFKTLKLFSDIAKILEPPPDLTVSQWADRYRKLSKESSAAYGSWNTDNAPYQRRIMDAVSDSGVEKVTVMSSAQVGKTEIVLNTIGYYMDQDPASILCVEPNIRPMAEDFSKHRLSNMIRDTPVLRKKIRPAKERDSDNTIFNKSFPGGYIAIAGANAPSGLASRPCRVILLDEIDRYPASAGKEGDPVQLAIKRSNTFWNRKIIEVSTPTTKEESKIYQEFLHGSQEEWCVRCPDCGKWQPYSFKRLVFESMSMKCECCEVKLSEKDWKSQPHQWIAKHPNNKKHLSFHMNEMSSPWKTWPEIVQDFREANDKRKKTGSIEPLKVFINTALGEPWEERPDSEQTSVKELLERREIYDAEVPERVVVLTAGVDVQDDRLELEICGWAEGFESWGIKKAVIYSSPALDETWQRLEEYYEQIFYFSDGTPIQIACMCVDTGGNHTNRVYQFIFDMKKKRRNIHGIKGYAGKKGIPLIYRLTPVEVKNDKGVVINKTKIFILGVDSGKEDLAYRLTLTEWGPGYCHFPKNEGTEYDQTYFEGLTSEDKITTMDKNGHALTKWKKKRGIRNEPLDMRNYNYAAVTILSPNWKSLSEKIQQGVNYMAKSTKKKRKKAVSGGIQI